MTDIQLKYEQEISGIADCPPDDAMQSERSAYRFVHLPIAQAKNFLPVAKLHPQRRFRGDVENCISFALSMFASREKSIARFRRLRKRHRLIHKTLGTHLASGVILERDGLVTDVDRNNHFSFFESVDSDLSSRFQVVERLAQ